VLSLGLVHNKSEALSFLDASTEKEDTDSPSRKRMRKDGDEEDAVEEEPSSAIFHPDFTYPLYGEEEKLFGFQGLDVKVENLSYRVALKVTCINFDVLSSNIYRSSSLLEHCARISTSALKRSVQQRT
jgi:hypothetical protein